MWSRNQTNSSDGYKKWGFFVLICVRKAIMGAPL